MPKKSLNKNSSSIRLGVNIDHVATVRNARGGIHPCPIEAAKLAKKAGADGITAHLREDRRHIRDNDIVRLKKEVDLPLNLEMAATREMLAIAIKIKPNAVCLVPEKREEITTEGGLDVIKNQAILAPIIKKLQSNKIRVSLFINDDLKQIKKAKELGANIIELHTGSFCEATSAEQKAEFKKLSNAAKLAEQLGLECHAGHGLNYQTAQKIAKIPQIKELNIGHFIIGEAISDGIIKVIKKMKKVIS
jgi:pyridoxine 5-phosphate synthase